MSLALYFCHGVSYFFLKKTTFRMKDVGQHNELSYYFVHLLAALVLGIYGLSVYPFQPGFEDLEAREKIINFFEMIPFGEMQIAYQIWSLPAGILFVPEPVAMLVHHSIVIVLGSVVAFSTNAFRYYAPFFFGIVEISSIPLSIVNVFKSDKSLQDRFPTTNALFSGAFALSFLYIRVYLLLQNIWDFGKLVFAMMVSCPGHDLPGTTLCMVPYFVTLICSACLTLLQIFWAFKIIMHLLKVSGVMKKTKIFPKNE